LWPGPPFIHKGIPQWPDCMCDRCHTTLGGGIALQGYAPSCLPLCLARCANGTRPAGLVRHYRACCGNDAFCKSAAVDFHRASSMHVPGGDMGSLHGIPLPRAWHP
jgi:hypothetical protein